MNTRMEKYANNIDPSMSRSARNQELYQTIGKSDIDNYEIKSNATVLGSSNKNQIDVEQIKKILDTRYNEAPKRKSIRLETTDEVKVVPEESTKEYDINAIIEKARNDKPLSYEEERIKKLRDTQFNILNKLNVEKDSDSENKEETKLLELINTITMNEDKNKNEDADLDLFSDLKGDDNTEVFEGMKEEVTEKLNKVTEETKTEKTISLDNTGFSKSMDFTKKDFEDFDLDSEKTGTIGKILIVVILIAFIVGIVFFVKSVFNV